MRLAIAILICVAAASATIVGVITYPKPDPVIIPPSGFGPDLPVFQDTPDTEDACLLPIERGNCRGSIRKYGYDQTINQCVPFIWSGCGGNRNRFPKKIACERACRTSFN